MAEAAFLQFLDSAGNTLVAFLVLLCNSLDSAGISGSTVILFPGHPASFAHNFVSGMQSFHFSESQDAIVLQTCHEK